LIRTASIVLTFSCLKLLLFALLVAVLRLPSAGASFSFFQLFSAKLNERKKLKGKAKDAPFVPRAFFKAKEAKEVKEAKGKRPCSAAQLLSCRLRRRTARKLRFPCRPKEEGAQAKGERQKVK
jgi:hypothetical protein